MPAIGLPMVTFDSPITFHMDGEEADAIPVPHAHTDGDTIVHFHNADVIMSGDFFRSAGYPNIDRAGGGSFMEWSRDSERWRRWPVRIPKLFRGTARSSTAQPWPHRET